MHKELSHASVVWTVGLLIFQVMKTAARSFKSQARKKLFVDSWTLLDLSSRPADYKRQRQMLGTSRSLQPYQHGLRDLETV